MKISLNTLRYYQQHYQWAADPAPEGADVLVEKIGAQLGAVEETINFGSRFEGVIVARVVSCVDHENSDHLHVCKIDDGGVVQDIERDENGYVQVVCGAPNVREGLLVAWLPPGSTVPETFGTDDPFVLSARPLRGVVSNGMLASIRELGLGDDHDGILEIDKDVIIGTSFAEAFSLKDDIIIDIENKMFTHRPDCFGLFGVAREIAGIQHQPFKSPDWYIASPEFRLPEADILPLQIQNALPESVPRFMAVALSDVRVAQSPLWLKIELAKVGIKSINNIVDYTNYFMILTGQPLHAYDYDKVLAQDEGADVATLAVRYPMQGEKIKLLNGKEIEPRSEAIMIATRDKLIGVGGVMGGADTEVDENTTNIILECATFDMYSIRRTSMAHGLFTDAVTRNNKGQSPLQNAAVIVRIVDELRTHARAKIASDLIDSNHLEVAVRERASLFAPVKVGTAFINTRLGLTLTTQQIMMLLTNVEFSVIVEGDDLIVSAPFWRTDIEIAEDIVEEVGRLYGFDQLPLELPMRDLTPAAKDPMYELKKRIRTILASAGANEILTYGFVHGNLLQKAGQKPEQAFSLANALSPDLQYLRMSLTPSLLDKIHMNIKAGHNSFALFEMNKTHNLLHAADDNGLPTEFSQFAFVCATNDKNISPDAGAALYDARAYLDFLAAQLGLTLEYSPVTEEYEVPVARPFEISRSAFVSVAGTDIFLGMVGEYKTAVRKKLKLPVHTAGFEMSLDALVQAARSSHTYTQLPRFPKSEQDICFRVPSAVTFGDLSSLVSETLEAHKPEQSIVTLTPIDIYQKQDDDSTKQITFRISATSYVKTLRDEEMKALFAKLIEAAAQKFQAEVI